MARLNRKQQDLVRGCGEAIERAVQRFVAKRPDTLTRHSFDDLVQEATAAACAAHATFCASGGLTLERYVFGCVKFALMRYASQSHREFATPEDVVADVESEEPFGLPILDRLLRRLPKEHRRLIVLRYGLRGEKPHSLRETARKFQVDERAVRDRQQQIEATLSAMASKLALAPPP